MSGLAAGDLDRLITLETATVTQSPVTGEEVIDWTAITPEQLWAQWIPGGTKETWDAKGLGSEIDGVYRTHYRADVFAEASRIIGHDGRTYDVRPPIELGRQEGLLIPVVARGDEP